MESEETGTVLVLESLMNPARVLRTPWTEKIIEMENRKASLEELAPMISGKVSYQGWNSGDLSEGMYHMGQVIGLIDDVPTVADLMKRIMQEAAEAKKRLDQMA